MPTGGSSSRASLLQLYKQLLRACETYPSKKRVEIYQAIREEWRSHKDLDNSNDKKLLQTQIAVAYKGLSQLQQFSIAQMSGGRGEHSPHWSVTLEQNPMPKPADWEERKQQQQQQDNDDDSNEKKDR